VEQLVCAPELMIAYLSLAPNAKLPPKKLESSWFAEHKDNGPIFNNTDRPEDNATKWSGIVRTNLTKFRELVQYHAKYRVIAEQAKHMCVFNRKSYLAI